MSGTLAIPPKRVRLYRSLWDRWIIVLRIMFDLGAGAHPVRWQAIADTLLVDKATSKKYCAALVRDGHLAIAGEGYMLTDAGMSILAETEEGEFLTLETGNRGEILSPLKESVVVVDSELKPLTTPTTKLGKNHGENLSPPAAEAFHEPDVKVVLENISLLFDGAEITFKKLPHYLHIEKVLGWVAYCFDRRASMDKPVGVLHSKLADGRSPSPSIKYLKDPCKYLPDEFLCAIGRFAKTCPRCQTLITDLAAFESHLETCTYTFIEEADGEDVFAGPDATVTEQVVQAWRAVLEQLRNDLPKASFQTWLEDTQPVSFEKSIMRIGTRNTYARDWLTKNIQAQAWQLASKALSATVGLEFVSVETGE